MNSSVTLFAPLLLATLVFLFSLMFNKRRENEWLKDEVVQTLFFCFLYLISALLICLNPLIDSNEEGTIKTVLWIMLLLLFCAQPMWNLWMVFGFFCAFLDGNRDAFRVFRDSSFFYTMVVWSQLAFIWGFSTNPCLPRVEYLSFFGDEKSSRESVSLAQNEEAAETTPILEIEEGEKEKSAFSFYVKYIFYAFWSPWQRFWVDGLPKMTVIQLVLLVFLGYEIAMLSFLHRFIDGPIWIDGVSTVAVFPVLFVVFVPWNLHPSVNHLFELFFTTLLQLTDVVSDIFVTVTWIRQDHISYAFVQIFILILSQFFCAWNVENASLIERLFIAMGLGRLPLVSKGIALHLDDERWAKKQKAWFDVEMYEICMETIPSVVLQLFALFRSPNDSPGVIFMSVLFSALNLGKTVIDYLKEARQKHVVGNGQAIIPTNDGDEEGMDDDDPGAARSIPTEIKEEKGGAFQSLLAILEPFWQYLGVLLFVGSDAVVRGLGLFCLYLFQFTENEKVNYYILWFQIFVVFSIEVFLVFYYNIRTNDEETRKSFNWIELLALSAVGCYSVSYTLLSSFDTSFQRKKFNILFVLRSHIVRTIIGVFIFSVSFFVKLAVDWGEEAKWKSFVSTFFVCFFVNLVGLYLLFRNTEVANWDEGVIGRAFSDVIEGNSGEENERMGSGGGSKKTVLKSLSILALSSSAAGDSRNAYATTNTVEDGVDSTTNPVDTHTAAQMAVLQPSAPPENGGGVPIVLIGDDEHDEAGFLVKATSGEGTVAPSGVVSAGDDSEEEEEGGIVGEKSVPL